MSGPAPGSRDTAASNSESCCITLYQCCPPSLQTWLPTRCLVWALLAAGAIMVAAGYACVVVKSHYEQQADYNMLAMLQKASYSFIASGGVFFVSGFCLCIHSCCVLINAKDRPMHKFDGDTEGCYPATEAATNSNGPNYDDDFLLKQLPNSNQLRYPPNFKRDGNQALIPNQREPPSYNHIREKETCLNNVKQSNHAGFQDRSYCERPTPNTPGTAPSQQRANTGRRSPGHTRNTGNLPAVPANPQPVAPAAPVVTAPRPPAKSPAVRPARHLFQKQASQGYYSDSGVTQRDSSSAQQLSSTATSSTLSAAATAGAGPGGTRNTPKSARDSSQRTVIGNSSHSCNPGGDRMPVASGRPHRATAPLVVEPGCRDIPRSPRGPVGVTHSQPGDIRTALTFAVHNDNGDRSGDRSQSKSQQRRWGRQASHTIPPELVVSSPSPVDSEEDDEFPSPPPPVGVLPVGFVPAIERNHDRGPGPEERFLLRRYLGDDPELELHHPNRATPTASPRVKSHTKQSSSTSMATSWPSPEQRVTNSDISHHQRSPAPRPHPQTDSRQSPHPPTRDTSGTDPPQARTRSYHSDMVFL